MSNPDTTRIFNYPEVTTPASDAKILLDSQTVGSKCIDANLFRCDLIDKTITQRGTFEASEDDADGFKKVVVDIPYTDVHVASGPIATFEGEDLPLKSLTASIVPVQAGSGDPSPTNVRPISGWTEEVITRTGKNFIPNTGYIKGLLGWNEDTAEAIIDSYSFITSPYIKVNPNTNYAIHTYAGAIVRLYITDKNHNKVYWKGNHPTAGETELLKIPANGYYVRFSIGIDGQTVTPSDYGTLVYAQLELGSTPTTYEPYNGHTYTIPFTDGQGQSHTSYGGQIDVISGKEDDTYGIYQKTNFALPTTKDNKNRWEFGTDLPDVLSDLIGSMTRATTDYDLMCNNMTIKLESDASVGETTCSLYGHSNRVEWRIRISDEYTAEEAQAIANASVIRYPINIVTLQQQPTSIKSLDGENNVFASTGDVDVEYQTVWVRPTE